MHKRSGSSAAIVGVLLLWLAANLSACGGGASTSSLPNLPASASPSPSPSDSPPPSATPPEPASSAATSHEEFVSAACAAWDALFRGVGNPDTGNGSDLSRALDQAVESGDANAAERVAAAIVQELEAGRGQVAIAGTWQPQAPMMVQFDRVFAAYEAMIAAKVAAAKREPNAVAPQAAFEAAGGVEAYFAMLALFPRAAPAEAQTCPHVPVTMP